MATCRHIVNCEDSSMECGKMPHPHISAKKDCYVAIKEKPDECREILQNLVYTVRQQAEVNGKESMLVKLARKRAEKFLDK